MSKDIELMKGYGLVLKCSLPCDNAVRLIHNIGVTAYRFSLSWARIIPMGGRDDPINSKGIEYYSTLIDALLANGIRPFVTLLHWDVPLALYHRYGGMLNTTEFVQDFQRYADVCFANFGDRVKDWITFNEPVVVAQLVKKKSLQFLGYPKLTRIQGHGTGAFAPGRTSDRKVSAVGNTGTEPWRVIHTQILAHAHAARRYRTLNQGGQIGITFNADWAEPYSSSEDDIRAANRKLEFFVAVASDPIFGNGDYPESCKLQLGGRLPKFTSEEKSLIKGSSDFFGLNQ
jgi:beta-glucosidase